jgi:gliding motility-associated-like protein
MKKPIQTLLASLLMLMAFEGAFAQKVIITPDSAPYEELKKQGKLDKNVIIAQPQAKMINYDQKFWEEKSARSPMGGAVNLSCNCMQSVDSTYTIAPFTNGIAPDYRNDDGSTAEIQLPFTFCLYGNTYNSVYINNNGNVSFGASYGTFSASGFPDANFVMVAPFWADVDTRGGGGLVYFKIAPTHMIVKWEDVGYYSSQIDKLNDFQLVITDGTDPILPPGMNVNFCYGDMQWTTGSASQGVNGFGGIPANVGANKGDGIDYIQMGRFDQIGAAYDGPFNNNDGIDWLDQQSMFFNVCSSTNIAPIASGISICDTVKICGNDTLVIQPLFLSPELGQTTSVSVFPSNTPGVTILNSLPGNTASTTIQIVGSQAVGGMNTFVITATDDGIPAQSSVITLNIFIDTTGLAALNPTISGNNVICNGTPTTLSVPTGYDTYLWSNGSTTNTATYSQQGPVWVTVTSAGCTGSQLIEIVPPPGSAPPQIVGDSLICLGSTTVLTIANAATFTSFTWPDLSTLPTYTSGIGTVTVNAVDINNCNLSSTFTVNPDTSSGPSALIIGSFSVCTGGQTDLFFTTADTLSNFVWSTGDTTVNVTVGGGSYNLSLTDTAGCLANIPFNVTVDPSLDPNPNILGTLEVCTGGSTQLNIFNPNIYQTYTWNTGTSNSSINVGAGNYSLVATDTLGCSGTSNSVTVVENPALNPQPSIGGLNLVCDNGTTQLWVIPSYPVVTWSNFQTTDTITVGPGSYFVSVEDANGCPGQSNTALVTNFTPTVEILGNQPVCPGGTVTLNAVPNLTSGVSYLWSTSDTSSSIAANGTGMVTVTTNYSNGCTASASVQLSNFPLPLPSFTVNPLSPSPSGESIAFTNTSVGQNGATITNSLWSYGDGASDTTFNTTHIYNEDGTYTITLLVTSSDGCTDTISIDYDIISELEIPNVITPNGDGKNDNLVFKNLQYKSNSELTVFNRWGNKVYESADYKNDWAPAEAGGVYYYILTVQDLPKPLMGYFHVMK